MAPYTRQEFVSVAIDEWNIPFDRLSETAVGVGAQRHIRLEKDCKVDVRLSRDQPKQRRLILDRVRHEIGNAILLIAWPLALDSGSVGQGPAAICRTGLAELRQRSLTRGRRVHRLILGT